MSLEGMEDSSEELAAFGRVQPLVDEEDSGPVHGGAVPRSAVVR